MPLEHRATYVRTVFASLVAAILFVPLGFWARHIQVGPGTVPILDPEGRSFWLSGVFIAVVVAILFQILDTDQAYGLSTAEARGVRYEPASELPTAWIVPLVTTFSVVMLLGIYHSVTAIFGYALVGFLALIAASISRHHLYDSDASLRQRARGVYTILIHIIAFVALSMIYINKVRSLFSASAVLVVGILLLLQLLEGEDELFARRLVYAIVGGLMLGEITWVLNYWKATGWTGGAALLVFFYLSAGLILNQVREGVRVRDILEYGSVSAVAFGIVMYSLLT